MTKSIFEKSVMISLLLRHQTNVTSFPFWAPPNQNIRLRQCRLEYIFCFNRRSTYIWERRESCPIVVLL